MPRVSICIPAYNPQYFELSLRSAIAQTYSDVEILVSDDCPTDEIESICARFSSFVTYSRNPNPGPYSNIIRMIELSNGEYVKFVFDDDIINPFCVQFLLESLEKTKNNNTNLAFSPRYYINSFGNITRYYNPFNCNDKIKIINGSHFIKATAITNQNRIGEYSTVLFRKDDCFDQFGKFRLFDPKGYDLPDLSAWLDFARRGNFVIYPKPLSYFRQHEKATSNPANSPNFIYCILFHEKVLNKAREDGFISDEDLPIAYRNLISTYQLWEKKFPILREEIYKLESILSNIKGATNFL